MLNKQPTSAFLAVTLLCNSRCVMCDIWQNKQKDFLDPSIYSKLPKSLRMIDITGGEPFLRNDVGKIVKVIKQRCPKARLLITTNGFLTRAIKDQLPNILKHDPKIAFRVSLDGWGKVHDQLRGVPGAFKKATNTLRFLKASGIKDLGVIFTLMTKNQSQLGKIYSYSQKMKIGFSLNVVHDACIYFGKNKVRLRPNPQFVRQDFSNIVMHQIKSGQLRKIAQAWFNAQLYKYMNTGKRVLPCGAGESFFYMDSKANIYACQFKGGLMGNLQQSSFEKIWRLSVRVKVVNSMQNCHDCWMMCSARDSLKRYKLMVLAGLAKIFLAKELK